MRRTPLIAIGVVLVVLGAAALIWSTFGYSQRDTVGAFGSDNDTADTRKSLPLSPVLGGIALVGGIAFIVVGVRKSQLSSEQKRPST